MSDRDILIDVSRLIWRLWRGGLPTGVDRVCLAYVKHYRARAQAVVQRRGRHFVLTPKHSDELFALFDRFGSDLHGKLARLAVPAFAAARKDPDRKGLLYLNVGHTGLEESSLPAWIKRSAIRAVFLIHDLIPLLNPEYCRPGESAKHERRMLNVLKSAHGVIGNSQATVDDLARFAAGAGLPMPPAVAAWIAGPDLPPDFSPKTFNRAHFVTVGTIEARKNHLLLLQVWRRLIARDPASTPLLVIVGQRGWEASQTFAMLDRAAALRGHVVELARCGDAELAGLIAGARALLMPSFTEGFGLPVSEALQLKSPVIASDLPVFREFAGEIPTYLDPLDGVGWQSAITEFMGNSPEYERQKRALRSYCAPDWQRHFEVVDPWLNSLQ